MLTNATVSPIRLIDLPLLEDDKKRWAHEGRRNGLALQTCTVVSMKRLGLINKPEGCSCRVVMTFINPATGDTLVNLPSRMVYEMKGSGELERLINTQVRPSPDKETDGGVKRAMCDGEISFKWRFHPNLLHVASGNNDSTLRIAFSVQQEVAPRVWQNMPEVESVQEEFMLYARQEKKIQRADPPAPPALAAPPLDVAPPALPPPAEAAPLAPIMRLLQQTQEQLQGYTLQERQIFCLLLPQGILEEAEPAAAAPPPSQGRAASPQDGGEEGDEGEPDKLQRADSHNSSSSVVSSVAATVAAVRVQSQARGGVQVAVVCSSTSNLPRAPAGGPSLGAQEAPPPTAGVAEGAATHAPAARPGHRRILSGGRIAAVAPSRKLRAYRVGEHIASRAKSPGRTNP